MAQKQSTSQVVKSQSSPFNIPTGSGVSDLYATIEKVESGRASKEKKGELQTRVIHGKTRDDAEYEGQKTQALSQREMREQFEEQVKKEEKQEKLPEEKIVKIVEGDSERYVPMPEEGTQALSQREMRIQTDVQLARAVGQKEVQDLEKTEKELEKRVKFVEEQGRNIISSEMIEGATKSESYIQVGRDSFVPLSEYEKYTKDLSDLKKVKKETKEFYEYKAKEVEEQARIKLLEEKVPENWLVATGRGIRDWGEEVVGGGYDKFFGKTAMEGAEEMGPLRGPARFSVGGIRQFLKLPTDTAGMVAEIIGEKKDFITKQEMERKKELGKEFEKYAYKNPFKLAGEIAVPIIFTYGASVGASRFFNFMRGRGYTPRIKNMVARGKTEGLYSGDKSLSMSQRQVDFIYEKPSLIGKGRDYYGSGYIEAYGAGAGSEVAGTGSLGYIMTPKPVKPSLLTKITGKVRKFLGKPKKPQVKTDIPFRFKGGAELTSSPEDLPFLRVYRTRGITELEGKVSPFDIQQKVDIALIRPAVERAGRILVPSQEFGMTGSVPSSGSVTFRDIGELTMTSWDDLMRMPRVERPPDLSRLQSRFESMLKPKPKTPKFEELVKSPGYREGLSDLMSKIYRTKKTLTPKPKITPKLELKTTQPPVEVAAGTEALKTEITSGAFPVVKSRGFIVPSFWEQFDISTLPGDIQAQEIKVTPTQKGEITSKLSVKTKSLERTELKPDVDIAPKERTIIRGRTKGISGVKVGQLEEVALDQRIRADVMPKEATKTFSKSKSRVFPPMVPPQALPSVPGVGIPLGLPKKELKIKRFEPVKRGRTSLKDIKEKVVPKADLLSVTKTEWEFPKATHPVGKKATKLFIERKRKLGPMATFPTLEMMKGKVKGELPDFRLNKKIKFF